MPDGNHSLASYELSMNDRSAFLCNAWEYLMVKRPMGHPAETIPEAGVSSVNLNTGNLNIVHYMKVLSER